MDAYDRASPADLNKPSPSDFDRYLPWACCQMQLKFNIAINRISQNEYVSVGQPEAGRGTGKLRGKSKANTSKTDTTTEPDEKEGLRNIFSNDMDKTILIHTVYDGCDNLIHIKFVKNRHIPRQVFQLIGLIIHLHTYLNGITINRGINSVALIELNKLIRIANITDVCLDNTYITDATYHILLEDQNNIKQLSLARCSIDDDMLKDIVAKLQYPFHSSHSLSILNISSNKITNIGAKYIAEVLRTNRQLLYLNLAGNMITDEGAILIFDVLIEFPLKAVELLSYRARYFTYLKDKQRILKSLFANLKSNDDKKLKKKNLKPIVPEKKVRESDQIESSNKTTLEAVKQANIDALFYEKAEALADDMVGEFVDPFSSINITVHNDMAYCRGNNTLSYVSLAYNNISYASINKLLQVLNYQKAANRKPLGLINVNIEGNSLPVYCRELYQINDMLENAILAQNRRFSAAKKRTVVKSK